MKHSRPLLWIATIAVGMTAVFSQQTRAKIPDPKIERAWVEDEDGKRHWAELEGKCPDCRGVKKRECERCKGREISICAECEAEKKATCRTCSGTGKVTDPLVDLICPYCWGSSWYRCALCNGGGGFKVNTNPVKCLSCKETGSHACTVCDGKRRIPVAKVGSKGPGRASAKNLRKAKATLEECLVSMQAFEPQRSPAKSLKAFSKIVSRPSKVLPSLKDMHGMLEEILKGLRHGASYPSYEPSVTHQIFVCKDRTVYLLRHQILLLDICLQRAEHNEQAKSKD